MVLKMTAVASAFTLATLTAGWDKTHERVRRCNLRLYQLKSEPILFEAQRSCSRRMGTIPCGVLHLS